MFDLFLDTTLWEMMNISFLSKVEGVGTAGKCAGNPNCRFSFHEVLSTETVFNV